MARSTRSLPTDILLTVAFVVLIVPVGLVLRLVRDPMRRRWQPGRASYLERLTL
jgi:hypothetical protein